MTDRASRQDIETALRSQGVLTEALVQWLADLDERVAALDAARRKETIGRRDVGSEKRPTHRLMSMRCKTESGVDSWHYHENGGIYVCIESAGHGVFTAKIPARSLRQWAKVDAARREETKHDRR